MLPPLNAKPLPNLRTIDKPEDVTGGKFVPYSMAAVCILLAGYSIWPSSETGEEEEEEE